MSRAACWWILNRQRVKETLGIVIVGVIFVVVMDWDYRGMLAEEQARASHYKQESKKCPVIPEVKRTHELHI